MGPLSSCHHQRNPDPHNHTSLPPTHPPSAAGLWKPAPQATHPLLRGSLGTSGLGGGVMSPAGESGRGGSSISSGLKFSFLTTSSLSRLTLGAGEADGRNEGSSPALHPTPEPGAPEDILGGKALSLATRPASCRFLALPPRFSGGPPGEQGVAAPPPAAASSNGRRARPTVGQGSLEGDRAAVPARDKVDSSCAR